MKDCCSLSWLQLLTVGSQITEYGAWICKPLTVLPVDSASRRTPSLLYCSAASGYASVGEYGSPRPCAESPGSELTEEVSVTLARMGSWRTT